MVKITELDPHNSVERELLLATVRADAETAGPGGGAGADLRGQDPRRRPATPSPSRSRAHPSKLDDFEELLRGYGIVELQRTGRVALPKLDRDSGRLRALKGKAS